MNISSEIANLIKHKTITGTTNSYGTLYNGNSNITGGEIFLNARCISAADYMVITTGYGTGNWLKVVNYDFSVIANKSVTIDAYYV